MSFKKNKYVNYQTLIKLIKKLLCFVINSCTFVKQLTTKKNYEIFNY
jgi:hypothetical protein